MHAEQKQQLRTEDSKRRGTFWKILRATNVWLRKFLLVLYKHLLIRRYHYVLTICELLLPILVMLFVAFIGVFSKPAKIPKLTIFPKEDPMRGKVDSRLAVFFIPDIPYTQDFVKYFDDQLRRTPGASKRHVDFYGLKDEQTYADGKWPRAKPDIVIIFKLAPGTTIPDTLEYQFVLNVGTMPTLAPDLTTIQHVIALHFMQKVEGHDMSANVTFTMQRFPELPGYPHGSHVAEYSVVYFGILIPIAFVLIIPALLTQVVSEKASGIKELLRLMGLPRHIQWLGFTVNIFVIMFISSIVIVLMMTNNIFPNIDTLIQKTEVGPLLLVFTLYILSSIAFCFFLSTMCSRVTRATVFGLVVWFMSFCIPLVLTEVIKIGGASPFQQLLWALLPNMALFWSLRFIAFLEYTSGLESHHYFHAATVAEDMCLFPLLMMFVLDFALYWFLAWYFDQVFPGHFGVPRPWYFLCTESSCKRRRKNTEAEHEPHQQTPPEEPAGHSNIFKRAFEAYMDPVLYKMKIKAPHPPPTSSKLRETNFEAEPEDLPKVVAAENLRKVFKKVFSPPLVAVEEVTLNVFQGQIFVILGENGAGKTVTLSMIAGVFAPTSGTAYIHGFNIQKEVNQAREAIGFCPQGDIMFRELTVKQHFKFFGRLKGLRGSILTGEVNFLLQRLKLWEYRKKRAKQLPGGMKRRLQLGMAVIGHVQLIILDEPTSGMDLEARRIVWNLLFEKRSKCCIIITTNHMQEADALADRIAIMWHGRIVCSGSPTFLKAHFGADYVMKVTKTAGCDANQVLQLIQRHTPEAYIDTETQVEFSIVLPIRHKKKFPDIFRDLEARLDQLKIGNFGLSTMGMEEVFLKVNETADKKSARMKTPPKQPGSSTHGAGPAPIITTDTYIEPTEGKKKLLQRFRGLMMKRVDYMQNRMYFFFLQFTYVVVTTILVLLMLHKMGDEETDKNWMEEVFNPEKTLVIFEQHDTTQFCLPDAYTSNIPEDVTIQTLSSNTDIAEEIVEMAKKDPIGYRNRNYIMAASFTTGPKNILLANAMYYLNSDSPVPGLFRKIASLNFVHNALLRNCHKEDIKIVLKVNMTTIRTPQQTTPAPKVKRPARSTIAYKWSAATLLAGGFSLMVSCFVYLVTQERVTQSKHMQFMTGTSSLLYWATALLFDYLFYLSCAILCIIMLVIFDGPLLSVSSVPGVMFLAMLLFGWCAIPFAYLISFCAKSPTGAYVAIIIIHLISGAVLQTIWLLYDYGNFSTAVDYIYVVFELLPACCFVSIFLKLWTTAGGQHFHPMTWANEGVGRQLTVLTLAGLAYMLLVLLLELRSSRCIRFTVALLTKTLTDTTPPELEPDVDAEDRRVKDLLYHRYHSEQAVRSTSTVTSLGTKDVLLVDSLTKRFTAKAIAVDHLTFGVRSDECFGLLGVNGAGKSTTFRMLAGSVLISLGNAYLYQMSLKDDRSKFLSQVGYCPQYDALLDHLTSREMLLLFARLRGISEDQVESLVDAYLDKFGLKNYAYLTTAKYSLGTKRKLSVALAFLGAPLLVLLDEPTTGVDPTSRRRIWEVILSCKSKGTAVVLSSHSMDECEVLCSRVAILKKGQFKCLGTIQYLKSKGSKGFKVSIKVAKVQDTEEQLRNHDDVIKFMEQNFTDSAMIDEQEGLLEYSVPYTSADWHKLFTMMEEAKQKYKWEDYFVCQATLEDVFLDVAQDKSKTDTYGSESF